MYDVQLLATHTLSAKCSTLNCDSSVRFGRANFANRSENFRSTHLCYHKVISVVIANCCRNGKKSRYGVMAYVYCISKLVGNISYGWSRSVLPKMAAGRPIWLLRLLVIFLLVCEVNRSTLTRNCNITTSCRNRRKFFSRVIYYGPNRDAGYNPCEMPLDCVHPNPGPVKNPCALCERAIARNRKAICCEECGLKFHIKCTGNTVKKYSLMVSGNKSWTCQPCYAKFMHELPFNSVSLNSSLMEDLNLSTVSEVSEEAADDREDFSFLRKEYRKECIIAS